MRRELTQSEKELLSSHTKDIVGGILNPAKGVSTAFGVLGAVMGLAIGGALLFLLPKSFVNSPFFEGFANLFMRLGLIIMSVIMFIVGRKAGSRLAQKKVFSKGKYYINGCTVNKVLKGRGRLGIREDGFIDVSGRPYDYLLPCTDYKDITEGQRMILISNEDAVCFLMRPTEATKSILDSFQTTFDTMEPFVIDHPNIFSLDEETRVMSDEEKAAFYKRYKNFGAGKDIVGIFAMAVFTTLLTSVASLAMFSSMESDLALVIVLIFWVISTVGLIFLDAFLMIFLNRRPIKKAKTVRKAMFVGFSGESIGISSLSTVLVVEKEGNEYKVKNYTNPLYSSKEKNRLMYGKIVNVYEGEKTRFIGIY